MEDVEDIEAWLAAARAGCSDKDLAELGLTVPKPRSTDGNLDRLEAPLQRGVPNVHGSAKNDSIAALSALEPTWPIDPASR